MDDITKRVNYAQIARRGRDIVKLQRENAQKQREIDANERKITRMESENASVRKDIPEPVVDETLVR